MALVEVRGIVGDLERFAVVEQPHRALVYNAERIGVVCQTTTPPSVAEEVLEAIRERNEGKEVKFVVKRDRDGRTVTSKYQGSIDGDRIKGTINTDYSGEDRKLQWEAKRQK